MNKLFKKLMKYLPYFIQSRIVYKLIKINYNLDDNIVFKIAETKDEITQALILLQETYKDENLANDNEGLRATIYHALPTTTIIIAKIREEVVGTVSHVGDSSLGLPLEKIFDLSKLRNQGKKICEIGSLAVKKDLRKGNSELDLYNHLIGFTFKFSREVSKDDYLCLATHPRAIAFYYAIAPFKPISKDIKQYNFVGNSPAYAIYLDHEAAVRSSEHRFEFGSKINKYFELCIYEPIHNYKLPKANPYCSPHRILTPDELNELFFIKTSNLKTTSNRDKAAISNIYNLQDYKISISQLDCSAAVTRETPRYNLTIYGHLEDSNNTNTRLRIIDISRHGLQVIFTENINLRKDAYVTIQVKLENYDSILIQGNIAWSNANKAGICINHMTTEDQNKWDRLIDAIESKFKVAA